MTKLKEVSAGSGPKLVWHLAESRALCLLALAPALLSSRGPILGMTSHTSTYLVSALMLLETNPQTYCRGLNSPK